MTVTHDIKHYIIVCTVTPLPKKVALGLNLLAVFASPAYVCLWCYAQINGLATGVKSIVILNATNQVMFAAPIASYNTGFGWVSSVVS